MYNLKGGKILQNYPSLARICHLFTIVCVLRIVTFRFASKYHFSFYNAPTFRFAGLTKFGQIFITPNSGRTFFITFNAKQSYPKRTILNGHP